MAETTLPHEQVWDDTDLVDSWNEAFAEYQVVLTSTLLPYSLNCTKT